MPAHWPRAQPSSRSCSDSEDKSKSKSKNRHSDDNGNKDVHIENRCNNDNLDDNHSSTNKENIDDNHLDIHSHRKSNSL